MAGWIIVAMLLAGPLPMLLKLGRSLWEREQYQFFPLMIVGAAAVAWERWQDAPQRSLRRGSISVTAALLAIALGVLAVAAMMWIRSASLVATLFILAAIAWRIGGWALLRMMGPSLVLLAIVIPPPGHQDQGITLRLQHMAVTVSCWLLDVIGIPNMQAGNVIEIPGRRLLVEQACSGINSLMAVLAFTLLYAFYLRRRLGRLALLLPAACMFVLGGNMVRITSEAVLLVRCHLDVTEGLAHQLLGMVLFAGCVALVASFDTLLGGAGTLPPLPVPSPVAAAPQRSSSIVGWPAWVAAGVFALAGVWVTARVWKAWLPPALAESATFELPPVVAGWDQVKSGAMFVERPQTEAAKSTVWQFRRGDTFASVALDYPFVGYHELTICYSVSGWKIRSEALDPKAGFNRVIMDKPDGDGYLLFSQVDEQGRPLVLDAPRTGEGFTGRLRGSLTLARQTALSGPSYQVQVMLQSSAPPTAEQRRSADALFGEVRKQLTKQLLAQLGGGQ